MKVLIQGAEILNAGSSFHKKEKNVLLQNGRIISIGDKNFSADKVIKAEGMKLSIGWFDVGAYTGDPGLEYKEDLETIVRAAAAGGFTDLAVLPNTHPAIQTKNEVSYIRHLNDNRLVKLHALAAVTKNNKGEELTEMIDLYEAGAVGFTDGLKPIWHTDVFLKTLQYVQKFQGVVLDHPEDIWLNLFGQMHEGVNSTMLGMKGMPRIAEEIIINRNVELVNYTGGRLHFMRLSTARSMELVRAAKKRLNITCDITSYQPLWDDSMLAGFDTNYKVNPPVREKADSEALIKGLKDGTIDIICSGHLPQDEENKKLEFDMAEFGIINLQTFGSNLVALSKYIDWEQLIEKVTTAPRTLFGLDMPVIEEDTKASLTLFDPNKVWTLDDKTNFSKSKNSPWYGRQLTGKVVAVFNNNKQWMEIGS